MTKYNNLWYNNNIISKEENKMETIIITLDNGEKKEYVKGIKLKEIIEKLKGKDN